MGKKQATPDDIKARLLLNNINAVENMNPAQRLEFCRKKWGDKKIALGRAVGFGLALIELQEYWKESPENIKDFIERHQELLEKYGSDLEEDKDQLMEWFANLHATTGFSVLSGWIDEDE